MEEGSRINRQNLIHILFVSSGFLIAGAVAALIWANVAHESYEGLRNLELWSSSQPHGGDAVSLHGQNTLRFLINGVLMAFFFAVAAKEVWESFLPGGALSSLRKAGTPLMATLGGMAVPGGLYLVGVLLLDPRRELTRGWAIPSATDVAFSYLVARLIFGRSHPAIAFLLLLAIADDAGGLIILAVFYPQGELQPLWLILTGSAVLLGFGLRALKLKSFWWYLLGPGMLSWFSMFKAGVEPALGLVPIIPTLPHAHTDLGILARQELGRDDALSAFAQWWNGPVEIILGLFGLVNAGVVLGHVGLATALVLGGLLIGKPLGITLFTMLGHKLFKLELPRGMSYRDVICLGMIAGMGFTVALFISAAAFDRPECSVDTLDAAKMGALASFASALFAAAGARLMRVNPG